MRHSFNILLFLGILPLTLLAQSLRKTSSDPMDGYSTYLNNELNGFLDNDRTDPGIAVSILSKSRTRIRNLKGSTDLSEEGALLSPSTSFYLASVTKPMTAYLVNRLIAEDLLKKNTKASSVLDLPKYMKDVTVQDLLNHTSGIPGFYEYITWREKSIDNDYVMKLLTDSVNALNFKPGSNHEYSNSNYILLAALAEQVTSKHFEELIQEIVFDEASMANSSLGSPKRNLPIAVGYRYRDEQFLINDYKRIQFPGGFIAGFNKSTYGSSGVFSTTADLERWLLFLMKSNHFSNVEEGATLPEDSYQLVDQVKYSNGWYTGSIQGYTTYWHSGEFGGYRNLILSVPEVDFAIIILSNNGKFNAEQSGLRWVKQYVSRIQIEP